MITLRSGVQLFAVVLAAEEVRACRERGETLLSITVMDTKPLVT